MFCQSKIRHSPLCTALGILALVFLSTPVTVLAEEPDQEYAQELFLEGREAFEAEEYLQAARIFEEVYEILDAPALLYNIGEAYRRADVLPKAEEFLQSYLNEEPEAPNADEVVERIIDIQQERVARQASLEITTSPSGATVVVDENDDLSCTSPCAHDLDPGTYRVQAELSGHHTATENVELEAQQDKSIELVLESEVSTGRLLVRSDSDDAVLIAGDQRHPLPHSEPIELETGSQTIAIAVDGERVDHVVDIEDGQELHLFIPVSGVGDTGSSTLKTTAVGLSGASLALFVAAGVTGMQVSSTHEELEAQQAETGTVSQSLVERGQRQQTLANGLFAGAFTTLAGSVGLWTWSKLRGGSSEPDELEPTAE